MESEARYEEWRGTAGLRMSEGAWFPQTLSEHQLQAHWFAGDFGRHFITRSGSRMEVVQFGIWNHQAGPDFAEAAVSLDGQAPVRGCIELDPDVRDWERHGHASNPDYESVALHAFTTHGSEEFFTRTLLHRNVPQVLLDLTRLKGAALNSQPEAKPGRCLAVLGRLPEEKLRAILHEAARFRLQHKAAALATLAELHGPDEALYQGLAAALGYKSNKLPFTLLAQRLPLRTVLKNKADADAWYFGMSGFLNATDLGDMDAPTRVYLRSLWERWWPRRLEFERLRIAPALWKMSGQRPANHPQRRLAALAQIVRHWSAVRALTEHCDPGEVQRYFHTLRDHYWEHHFTVTSKAQTAKMAIVGASRVSELLLNVFFPIAFNSTPQCWNAYQKLPAVLGNRRVEIAATRLFGDSARRHTLLKSAALQQGLLQIYEDFCMQDASDCARCPFPEQLARWGTD